MLFAVICRDREGALALRRETRAAHLDWIEAEGAAVQAAGPLLDEAGAPVGSILFAEAEDRAALDALLARDPYARAGLFAAVEARPFAWSVNPPPRREARS